MRSDETKFLDSIGVAPNQFNYWCSIGAVPGADPFPGPGNPRPLDHRQRRHLVLMAELVCVGCKVTAASRLASQLIDSGRVELGAIRISLDSRVDE